MTPTLPLLPNPDDADLSEWVGPFDAQQMHEFALAAIAAHLEAIRPEALRLADEIARLDTERAMCLWVHDDNAAMDRAIRARDADRAALAALMGGAG